MKKKYVPAFFGKIIVIAFAFLFSCSRVTAQVDIAIGTGTVGNTTITYPCPIQDWYEGSRAQYLYTAQELIAAGMGPGSITGIRFNVVALNAATITEQHTLRVGGTTVGTLDVASWVPGTNTVYGPVNYQPVVGLNTFTFTTPFFWNGTDNIIIESCGGDPNSTASITYTENCTIPWTTGLAFNGSHTYRNDNENNLCGTALVTNTGTATTRPNIIFIWTSATACSGTPNAGTVASSVPNACLNEQFNLSTSGQTLASGLSYQWQSSSDNINYTDITGATTPFLPTSQAATTYYHLLVGCTNPGGGVATSNSVQVFSPNLVNGNFTINSAQPTVGTNFASFNDAYNYIKCGINGPVVFDVVGGTGPYNEQLVMNQIPGASDINTVTFNGNGATIQYLSSNTNERATIKLNGTDYITLNSLVINTLGNSATEYGFGIQLTNSADSNTFVNCTINANLTSTSTNFAGIVISANGTSATATGTTLCDYNIFASNTIIGGYYGITLVGSSTDAVGNNYFYNNNVMDFCQYGFYVSGGFNTILEGNAISRPTRQITNPFYGIYFTGLSVASTISRNRIFNPYGGNLTSITAAYGIYFTANDGFVQLENKITNNLIYNFTGTGDVYGLYNSSSDNVFYYHNTIVLDGDAINTTAANVTRGFYQTLTVGGIDFRNNLIVITRGGASAKTAMYYNSTGSTITSDNNDFYFNASGGTLNVGFANATNYTLLVDWQTGSFGDANSIASNPVFASPLSFDYHPTNAAIDNRGAAAGLPDDFDFSPRSATTPDIGAYEFTPLPCSLPISPGAALVSTSTVCQNTQVSLGLVYSSFGLAQTYQWQYSSSPSGPFTPLGTTLTNPDTTILATANSLYYSVVVGCGASSATSVAVLLNVNPALPAGTYTINQTLPTGGTNYTNFAAVRAVLECGITGPVVFNVVSGTGPYNEQFILDSVRGASAINTITFNGNANTIQYAPVLNDERAVIKLRRADHVTFNNLVINSVLSAAIYGYGVQLINDADSNVINNCTILIQDTSNSFNYAGIVVNASETGLSTTGFTLCDGNVFAGNTIRGGYYGITLVGSSTNAIRSNTVLNNNIRDFTYAGVYVSGTYDTKIEANEIQRPTRQNVVNFYGIYFTGLSVTGLVTRNRIHDPYTNSLAATGTAYAIYFTGNDGFAGLENRVTNNLIYKFNGAVDQYGLYNFSSDNAFYYHNTIVLDDPTNISIKNSYGFYQTTAVTNVEFKNNIIFITRSGSGQKYGLYFITASSQISSNNNDFYINGPAGLNVTGFNGANRLTLADWQAVTTRDASSFDFNPEFNNPAIGDYTPLMTAMDNLGTPVGVLNDINDAARSTTTPDIGAYEFTIPACTAPPVAGTSTAVPNVAICVGQNVRLDIQGNSIGSGQRFQWESSPDNVNWAVISPLLYVSRFDWSMTTETYFRCMITCSSTSTYSSVVQVTLNPPLASGYYTINPALPATLPNFQSFTQVVNILECGIAGFVTFDVAPGTYDEQIRMHRVGGAGPSARVTFRSANGNPSSVILQYDSDTARNYTLKLDSASYLSFQNMSINAIDTSFGRAVVMQNTASYDSITNCIIKVPTTSGTTNNSAGLVALTLAGRNNVINRNSFSGGNYGIYFEGIAALDLSKNHVIDSNTVSSAFYQGVYTNFTSRLQLTRNTVSVFAPNSTTAYGINCKDADTAYVIRGNNVSISGTTGTVYGMYINNSDGRNVERGTLANNTVTADASNSSNLYGLAIQGGGYNNIVNNVVSINSSGASSYGLYSNGNFQNNYYNNSIKSEASSATNNVAAYFSHFSSGTGRVNIRNNIFAHFGGGAAMQMVNSNFIYSDYNMYYSNGTNLIRVNTTTAYATLTDWINATFWDIHSIVYRPAFIGGNDLRPDIASPDVWAIHGRGVQIPGNNFDFNGNARPTAITIGVPDLGAYEFLPTSVPTVLTASVPPAAGGSQTFMYGTDTVAIISYAAGSTVPTNVTFQRYSGVLPQGLTAVQQSMYFYTAATVTGAQPSNFSIKKFFIDPWQGFIPDQSYTKLGRTDASNVWQVSTSSTVDDLLDFIRDTALNYMDKFTGLVGDSISNPPLILPAPDSSNRGTRFWVAYAHHYGFENSNDQNMKLYFSAEQDANVTVKVNNTPYVREYFVPAGTVLASEALPKTGLYDSRALIDGKSDKGISIESNVPIVAYAHIYANTTSEAAMLLPVGTYGYEYTALTTEQEYVPQTYSWAYVIADNDSTVVEITPSNPTLGGSPARVPFTVVLNKGELYQVLGAIVSGSVGYDMTGTTFKSRQNARGRCLPMAVFSGSSRTYISCAGGFPSGGDNIMEQNFPYVAWGKRYLTAPTSASSAANSLSTNIFRVAVRDTATIVRRNGVQLTNLINGFYYEYESNTADVIEGSKPIIVAQIMSSSGGCPNTSGNGDPSMIYVSPIEQGIKRVGLYRTTQSAIVQQYVTLIIKNAGVTSLLIDGSNTFDYTYPHPNDPNFTVIVKRWATGINSQVIIQSDSAFTCITYGLGSVESYGYNGGTLVKNLNALPALTNTLGNGTASNFTCVGAPFQLSIRVSLKPVLMEWLLSQVAGISPNADVTISNPTPTDSIEINGVMYYDYSIPGTYTFNAAGLVSIPIKITHPDIAGCNSTLDVTLPITVIAAPFADFTGALAGCSGESLAFNGIATTVGGATIQSYAWDFSNPPSDTLQNTSHTFNVGGSYNVKFSFVTSDGCLGDTTKVVVINDKPVVEITPDSLSTCPGENITIAVDSPATGVVYTWYNTATGGAAINTGTTYSINNIQTTTEVFVEGTIGGCASLIRKRIIISVDPPLANPVAVVDSAGINFIRFNWTAVTNAVGYEVSIDNGATWNVPSSGTTGLTHTVSGLNQGVSVSLIVRALASDSCQNAVSAPVTGTTIVASSVWIPNSFTPNGDGRNDVMQVYGTGIQSMRFIVFNQWGQKLSESSNLTNAWDGTQRGKPQPSGVYMYVCEMVMIDGDKEFKKGAINLIR